MRVPSWWGSHAGAGGRWSVRGALQATLGPLPTRTKRPSPALDATKVAPIGADWADWTAAVLTVATLPTDFASLAGRSPRALLADLRGEAREALQRLPVDHLALLLEEVGALKADAKHLADLLHDALHARYGAPAAAARRAEGKDTGRVRVPDDGFEIVADLPKKAAWDQPKLAAAVATIVSWGEDPADYVTTEIRVPESRFTAWPPRIRAVFEPARTVATGRPSYTLEQKDAA